MNFKRYRCGPVHQLHEARMAAKAVIHDAPPGTRSDATDWSCQRQERQMCWQCGQIDKEIDYYRGLCARAGGEESLRSLKILIDRLEAEKARLHIERL
jgi:hypothetical protein